MFARKIIHASLSAFTAYLPISIKFFATVIAKSVRRPFVSIQTIFVVIVSVFSFYGKTQLTHCFPCLGFTFSTFRANSIFLQFLIFRCISNSLFLIYFFFVFISIFSLLIKAIGATNSNNNLVFTASRTNMCF